MAWQRYTDTVVITGNGRATPIRYTPQIAPKRWRIVSGYLSWLGLGAQTSATIQLSLVTSAGIVFANIFATPELQATIAGAVSFGQGLIKDSEAPSAGPATIGVMGIPNVELGSTDSLQFSTGTTAIVSGTAFTLTVQFEYDNCDGGSGESNALAARGPYASA